MLLLVGCLGQSSPQEQTTGASQQPEMSTETHYASPEDSLNRFLWRYLARGAFPDQQKGEQYLNAFVDLNGDQKDEAVVYLASNCGTGGCYLLILTPKGSSYSIVGGLTLARLPIRVLNSTSHGWRSLAMQIRGGGAPSHEARIEFDGDIYRRLGEVEEQTPGEVLIPDLSYEFSVGVFGNFPRIEEGKGKVLFRPNEQPSSSSGLSLTPEEALHVVLQDSLRGTYLGDYLKGAFSKDELPLVGYHHTFFDLDGDGKDEVVAYITGPSEWNTTLVLTPEGVSYKLVGDIRRLDPPIRVLSSLSNGWRNLSGRRRESETLPSQEVGISFDGVSYVPRYAEAPSALPVQEQTPGEVLIPDNAIAELGKRLFIDE
jgi:hypothetical protein